MNKNLKYALTALASLASLIIIVYFILIIVTPKTLKVTGTNGIVSNNEFIGINVGLGIALFLLLLFILWVLFGKTKKKTTEYRPLSAPSIELPQAPSSDLKPLVRKIEIL